MNKEGILLRVFINENAHHGKKLLYRSIIDLAREHQLAGATVIRGICGFQGLHHVRESSFLALSDDLPVIVEIIDTEERITVFLPALEALVDDGLITTERVGIVKSINKKA